MPFDPVDPKQSFPELERGILKYWREEDTFKRSLHHREGCEHFHFYDGPPFATGLPHYGHILAGTIKDVIPRYQTMRGKYVKRRFGWDCHGLPVENEIEKEQNLKTKRDIEALGVKQFNALCRAAVQRYSKEWRTTVERFGRWVDMDWDYRTMDPDYMESIWWVFKQLHEKGLIYEGHKPMHICPRCQTPLSNFEVTQAYREVADQAVTVMFELEKDTRHETRDTRSNSKFGKTYLLAWTTTAWTLPGNLFLAVGKDVDYVQVERRDAPPGRLYIIVAKDRLADVFKGKEYTVLREMKGKELLGMHYKPLFSSFADRYRDHNVFRVVDGSEFVTTQDGTGIVHIAPGFGEDDYNVGKREKVPLLQHVGMDGKFISDVKEFAGMDVKPKDNPTSADKLIAKHLKAKGLLFDQASFTHSYPHCWRCDSPLLNYATSSWFVAVEKIKEDMLKANAKTEWVPSHLRDGRFGKWLEGARDWAISRNRYWGTPLPIWRDALTGKVDILGSRDELMAKSGNRFTKVTVTRHAESQGNVDRVYQGLAPGTDLTERGREQAKAMTEAITSPPDSPKPSIVYCSPLARTFQTAEAIASASDVRINVDERLKEVRFGEYEGKHIDFDDLTFVRERRAHKLDEAQVESIYHFPGMETWNEVEVRVKNFLEEILPRHKDEHIVIVTHADLVMNFSHLFTKQDKHKIVHQPYPPLGGYRTFYWDHETGAQMDLHKEVVDQISWPAGKQSGTSSVDVTVVRHGETDYNKRGVAQGTEVDAPLNETGRRQVQALAKELKGKPFDVIVSSTLKRAVESAKILSKALGIPWEERWTELNERSMGEWANRPERDILREFPNPLLPRAKTLTFHPFTPKGGEGLEEFMGRITRARDRLLREYAGKRVLVVAHGGTVRAMQAIIERAPYETIAEMDPKNAKGHAFTVQATMQRIPDVLDCWFESGSMPYAQEHFPFEASNQGSASPPGFPADFIAEGLDQTRGWFYTLMVLSTALYQEPAFFHCIVNGIVLAQDGKKMSKRLKNYPEPTEIVEKHGADAIRFALMSSPAVRAEDLRFSEKLVEETLRSLLLPLWNAYRLFVTYANAADWKPSLDFSLKNATSKNLLDRWIVAKTQELVNRMTAELDRYDLSATCAHLTASIDDLTNWYIRLNRRRFSGKEEGQPSPEGLRPASQVEAFDTLYRVLVTNCQLLAPFCPFITETIYLNLVGDEHGSIHFTDWPGASEIDVEAQEVIALMDNTQTVVNLGLSLRSDAKVKVRIPLHSIHYALAPSDATGIVKEIVAEELNVKEVHEVKDATNLAKRSVAIDARKVGPRLGAKVQEIIREAKAGHFEERDGKIVIMGEELNPEEANITYVGAEGQNVASDHGIVVSLDITMTDELKLEGLARELIRAIQQLRKDAGLEFTDSIALAVTGADDILAVHGKLIESETRSKLEKNKGKKQEIEIEGRKIEVQFEKIDN